MKTISAEKVRVVFFTDNILYSITVLAIASVLVVHFFSLVSLGIDMPIYDDWRDLARQNAGSFSWRYLFAPANDTLYATGRLFDSLSIYLFSGNSVVYQGFSFVIVLGGLIYIQLSLLKYFSENKAVFSLASISMIFMLQSDTYWGLQSNAYQQALPILIVLAIVLIIVKMPLSDLRIHGISIFLIGVLGGFAYISGAIALFAVTVWTLLATKVAPEKLRPHYKSSAIGLGLATLVTLPAQLWVILYAQKGLISVSNTAWALPTQLNFWAFFLGMVARAIGYFDESSHLSLLLSGLFILVILGAATIALCNLRTDKEGRSVSLRFHAIYTYGALFLAVLSYAAIVSAGRANIKPDTVSSFSDMYSHAQLRFHFFWITILPPMALVFLGNSISERLNYFFSRSIISLAFILILLHAYDVRSVFEFAKYYNFTSQIKSDALACIYKKEAEGKRVICPGTYGLDDLTSAVVFARKIGLSFVRPIPFNEARDTSDYKLTPSQVIKKGARVNIDFPGGLSKNHNPIKRIGIMFGTYKRVNHGEVVVKLHSAERDYETVVDLSTLNDNEYHFEKVKPYAYSSAELISTTGEGVSLWNSHADGSAPAACLAVEFADDTNFFTPGCPRVENSYKNSIVIIFSIFAAFLFLFVFGKKA
jgi:hypothetical protein